jgi:MFS family permease
MKKKILFSASLFHALNDAATVTVPMIFPILYSGQQIIQKYSQIGILSNLGLIITFIFQIIIAHNSHKFEYRIMQFLSFVGICAMLALITRSSSFFSLLFLYLIMRIFTSFYHSIGIAWVSKTHPASGLDFAMGVQSGSGNFGVFIAFLSAGFFAQHYSWKAPLIVWAIAGSALGLLSFWAVRGISSKSEEVPDTKFSSWMGILKDIRVFIPGFFYGGACWGISIYFAPSLLNHKFQISMEQTGLYLALWIGIGTAVTYLFGVLSRAVGRFSLAITGISGSALSLFLVGISSKKEMTLAGLMLFGATLFLIYPAFQSFVGSSLPAKKQAQAFGIVANIQMISGALIVLLAGFISDLFDIGAPFILLGAAGSLVLLFYVKTRAECSR